MSDRGGTRVVAPGPEVGGPGDGEPGPGAAPPPLSGLPPSSARPRRGWLREMASDKGACLGVLVLLGVLVVAVLAPVLAPYGYNAQNLPNRLQPPAWMEGGSGAHLLGTDGLGRDVLSRMIYGSRTTMVIGVSVVLLSGIVGVTLGLLAGYRGRWTDAVVMRVIDIQFAFPGLLLAITILVMIRPGVRSVIIVLSVGTWMIFARVVRGTTLSVKESPFVKAAVIVGCREPRVIVRHILPNLVSTIMTLAILEFAAVVLAEASLSFLGLGVQPPAASWGLDVASGREYIFTAWWLVTFPGAAIAVTVLASNLVVGWLRVVFDPQERDKKVSVPAQGLAL